VEDILIFNFGRMTATTTFENYNKRKEKNKQTNIKFNANNVDHQNITK